MRKIIGTELLIVKGWRQLTLIEGREGRHSGDLADPSCCANLYQTGSMRGSQRHHIGTLAKKQSVNNSPTVPSRAVRSDEHKSELQSLMRSSYAVFCLKKK